MGQVNILVVEDNEDINRILRRYLEKEKYYVISAYSGTEAKLQFALNSFDLILLDLMLPGMKGEELINEIRKISNTPIIVISAKGALQDKVNALKNGADDYVVKPFERDEILARVEALLRRTQTIKHEDEDTADFQFKNLTLKPSARMVNVKGNPINLTAFEFDILLELLTYPDKVFTKEQLYQEIWKNGYYGEDNTINVHISNIRKKIKDYDEDSYIKTVWGIGFKMEDL